MHFHAVRRVPIRKQRRQPSAIPQSEFVEDAADVSLHCFHRVDKSASDPGCEHGIASCDHSDSVEEPLGGAVFEQKAAGTVTKRVVNVFVQVERRQDQYGGASALAGTGDVKGRFVAGLATSQRPVCLYGQSAHGRSHASRRMGSLWCQMLQSAWVGGRRAARMAGRSPARAPMSRAAARPPAQASGGMAAGSPCARA